jgi:L,D-transpeptidase ErfK/SrfK
LRRLFWISMRAMLEQDAGAGRGATRSGAGSGCGGSRAGATAGGGAAQASSEAMLAIASHAGPLLALVWGLAIPAGPLEPPALELAPLVGVPEFAAVESGDTLLDIAYRHRVGFEAVVRLNPDVDVWLPEPGLAVNLPTEVILPQAPREGLVLNIPEMRLFDFTAGAEPEIFAVAIGDAEDPTPIGRFAIGAKRSDPVWNVPDSILAERPGLAAQVPPGPANPLGDRWMTVGRTSYGIHGTNIRWSIGRVATHGCVRLYNEDMHGLYERVEEGTPLTMVYQTVKLGMRDGDVFLEVHPDVYQRGTTRSAQVLVRLLVLGLVGTLDRESIDPDLVEHTLERASGTPIRIGRVRTPPE